MCGGGLEHNAHVSTVCMVKYRLTLYRSVIDYKGKSGILAERVTK